MRQKPAKFREYRDHQIRLSRDGNFSVDSLTGEWPTLDGAKKAIDAALNKEVRVNALRCHDGYSDGEAPDLEPVVYLGPDLGGGRRARIETTEDGKTYKTHCYMSELFRDTAEVRAAWKRYQQLRREAHARDQEADRVREAIEGFKP